MEGKINKYIKHLFVAIVFPLILFYFMKEKEKKKFHIPTFMLVLLHNPVSSQVDSTWKQVKACHRCRPGTLCGMHMYVHTCNVPALLASRRKALP